MNVNEYVDKPTNSIGRSMDPLSIAGLGVSALGTIGSIFSQKSANKANIAMQRETNAQQYKMFQEGNKFNAEQAALERAFAADQAQLNRDYSSASQQYLTAVNSPQYQKAMMMAAGLNPSSVSAGATPTSSVPGTVQGSTASSVTPPSVAAPHVESVPVSAYLSQAGQSLASVLSAFSNKENMLREYSLKKKEFGLRKKEYENVTEPNARSQRLLNDMLSDYYDAQRSSLDTMKWQNLSESRARTRQILQDSSYTALKIKLEPLVFEHNKEVDQARLDADLRRISLGYAELAQSWQVFQSQQQLNREMFGESKNQFRLNRRDNLTQSFREYRLRYNSLANDMFKFAKEYNINLGNYNSVNGFLRRNLPLYDVLSGVAGSAAGAYFGSKAGKKSFGAGKLRRRKPLTLL